NPTPKRVQVAVVGGGLAGLTAARELEKHGLTVHLLEASERLGGKVATAYYEDGLSAEFGMQEMWTGSPLVGIARELGLELEEGEAYSSVLLDGKLYPYAQETANAFFRSFLDEKEYEVQQAWLRRSEVLYGGLEKTPLPPELEALQDISFEQWLQEQKLPPKVAEWARLTLECELGADAAHFSALSGLAEFRQFMFKTEKAHHVVGGNSRLVEALAASIAGPKTLNARVTRVERSRDGAGRLTARVTFLKNNRTYTLEADRVVLAVPWMVLNTLQLEPPLPPETWMSLMTIGRGQYVVVHFIADAKVHALWGGAARSPFPVLTRGPLGVIYGPDGDGAAAGKLVFGLLVYGDHAKAFHMAPHDQKRTELLGELDALWPGFSKHVLSTSIYTYHPAAVPFWLVGRSPYDAQAQALFEPKEGVYLAGDWLVSSHSEGAVIAGLRQARAIARELAPAK
ncbi:MAG: flavin monoamine oxidase family protein, partial [Myxococcales bacterium]